MATVACTLLLWEGVCRMAAVPPWLLPAPWQIAVAGFAVPMAMWFEHLQATLRVVLMGFGLALVISFPLAIAITVSPVFRRCIYPLLVIVQSTPVVAVAPILVVTLGATELPRVVITAMITFFPLVVGISTGLAQTPSELIELSRSLGAPIANQYRHIRLPFALPYIFSAIRVSITLAVIGAVVAEFVAAEKGIGYFIRSSTSFFKIPQAFAALLVLVASSLFLFQAVNLVQRFLFPRSLPAGSGQS
ncbi:ABC transporter permease [Microvirga lotononidis]|uniref:ABC transporter permease n=1 Tax=Microvirga lotononidis TaxID=864069 RepID=UPI001FD97005|nr:ABC transporter permease [Microvirga lotononidis]WQO28809.1 ABC transporter permease [Microvirga lotononidis]